MKLCTHALHLQVIISVFQNITLKWQMDLAFSVFVKLADSVQPKLENENCTLTFEYAICHGFSASSENEIEMPVCVFI